MLHLTKEQTSAIVITNIAYGEWPQVFGDARSTIALLDRLTNHYDIVGAGNEIWRFKSREPLEPLPRSPIRWFDLAGHR